MSIKNVKYDHRSLPRVISYRAQNSAQVGDKQYRKGEALRVDTTKAPRIGDPVVVGGLIRTFEADTIKVAVMGVIISPEVDDE
jgi:hypothetical protein